MSLSSGSYDFNLVGISISPPTNNAVFIVQLFDQLDGKYVSTKSILCPLDGVSPVLDGSRVLANQTPNGLVTPASNLISNAIAALSGARDQNKLRP